MNPSTTKHGRAITCGRHPHMSTVVDCFADAHPMGKPYYCECECGDVLGDSDGWFWRETDAWKAAMDHCHEMEGRDA